MTTGLREVSLELGNFAPFALLTGAGFSCNWGGLPASKIWEKIISKPAITQNHALRGVLDAAVGDYERALYLAATAEKVSSDDYGVLEQAIVDVFRSQEGRFSLAARAKLNESMVLEFLSFFGSGPRFPNLHGKYQTGYLFTLNQDWLKERLWEVCGAGYRRPFAPGVPVRMERFQDHQRELFDVSDVRRVPDSAPGRWPDLRQNPNYIKLHGSFEWRATGGANVLVMGGSKAEQIQRFPLLELYFEIFRRVCETSRLRLMTIGYGYRDLHVNEAIAEACRKRPGERWIYLIDPLWSSVIVPRLRNEGGADGAVIAEAILGGSSELLTDTFSPPSGHGRTEEYRRILQEFFDIELPA